MMAMIHADDKMIWTTDTVGGRAERDLFIAAGFAVKETGGYDENGRLQALFVGFDVVHQKGGCGGVPPGEGYIHVCAETQIDALVTALGLRKQTRRRCRTQRDTSCLWIRMKPRMTVSLRVVRQCWWGRCYT